MSETRITYPEVEIPEVHCYVCKQPEDKGLHETCATNLSLIELARAKTNAEKQRSARASAIKKTDDARAKLDNTVRSLTNLMGRPPETAALDSYYSIKASFDSGDLILSIYQGSSGIEPSVDEVYGTKCRSGQNTAFRNLAGLGRVIESMIG